MTSRNLPQATRLTQEHAFPFIYYLVAHCFSCSTLALALVVTCDFFLVIIVIAGGQKVSKDKSWDEHLLLFVLHHRDSFPVVPYGDGIRLPNRAKYHIHS